jgi:L-amino acid N-acyltransferase YncA
MTASKPTSTSTGKGNKGRNGRADGAASGKLDLPGHQAVKMRLMEPGDKDRMLAFARSLPPNDLLFLRTDITDPEMVDDWMRNIEKGSSVAVAAEIDGVLAGYAALHTDQPKWTRRIGEIRMQVHPAYRGIGLGRALATKIFELGQSRGLKKMAAMMTPDQTGARAAFERLGFQVEALLQDWVVDRDDRSRDLLIMSHDLEGSSGHMST